MLSSFQLYVNLLSLFFPKNLASHGQHSSSLCADREQFRFIQIFKIQSLPPHDIIDYESQARIPTNKVFVLSSGSFNDATFNSNLLKAFFASISMTLTGCYFRVYLSSCGMFAFMTSRGISFSSPTTICITEKLALQVFDVSSKIR